MAGGIPEYVLELSERAFGRVHFVLLNGAGSTSLNGKYRLRLPPWFVSALTVAQADLIRVAVGLHVADCVARRHGLRSGLLEDDGWKRRLRVVVPVEDPMSWKRLAADNHLLRELLEWLTDDQWEIRFTHAPRRTGQVGLSLITQPVALFSGGLDSFAGAFLDHFMNDRNPILFSVYTHAHIASMQNGLINGLRKIPRFSQINSVPVLLQISNRRESTQRTRGLLYLSLASTLASQGSGRVLIYENGIGAINLPLLDSQRGAMNSRSVHPRTLTLMQRLVSRALGSVIDFSNPFLWRTKGEMCHGVVQLASLEGYHDALKLMMETVSCDYFPRRRRGGRGSKQCDVCTSCLLRRAALVATGSQWLRNDTDYLSQKYEDPALLARLRFNDFAMSAQVDRLREALRSKNPWLGLVGEFPGLWLVRDATADRDGTDVEQKIVQLYRRYADEWDDFHRHSARMVRRGDTEAGIA